MVSHQRRRGHGRRGNGVRGIQETHLQQVHTIRLHAVDSLTDSLFYDWPGHFHRSKYAPLCCAYDIDRRYDFFDSSTLTTVEEEKKKQRGDGTRCSVGKRP